MARSRPEGEDLEADAPLLDAGPRRARHPVGVDLAEAVAVLVERVADGVRAVPEGGVEDVDVLVDRAPARSARRARAPRPRFREIGRHVGHGRASMAFATATSVASAPRAARMDRPTGSPATCAPGALTCGTPVRPPCAARQVMRARSGERIAERQALAGRGERGRGQAQDGAGRQEPGEAGPGLGAGQRGPLPLRLRDRGGQRQVARDAPGHARVLAIDPVLEGHPGLVGLQRALRAGPDRQAGRGQELLAHVPHQAREPAHHRPQRRRGLVVREAEGVGRDHETRRQLRRGRLAQQHLGDARERVGVAGEPPGGVGAGRLAHHAAQVEPAVGRPDAVEAAEARRHAHRSAGVGAERGVAEALGHRRGRARRGAAGHAVGRPSG